MKIQLYIGLIAMSCLLSACGKDQVGYLEASEARYSPDSMFVRNIANFSEERGWYNMKDFWTIEESDPDYQRYMDEFSGNYSHYSEDSVSWIGTPAQGIIGTPPIRITLQDVVSPDGGDVAAFKQWVMIWGDGTVEVSAMRIPAGTYILTMKVSNEGHSYTMKSPFIVKIKGKFPEKPIGYYDDEE